MLALGSSSISAEESKPGLRLLDRNSLAGWQYGDPNTSGWSVKDGVLHADSPKHTLLSGWTFGDFELRFRFEVSNGGLWTIALIEAPDGPQHRINFSNVGMQLGHQGPGSSAVLSIAPDIDHAATIVRRGKKITLEVGNYHSELSTADAPLGLQLEAAKHCTMSDLELTAPVGQPIFNGRDLTGWYTIGNRESWLVEDGKIVLVNKDGNYLRTEKQYGNFTLSLEYKIARRGNSGVGIRTPRAGWPSGDGMELQILDEKPGTPMTRHSTMSIYGNLEPLAKADKPDEWNRATIKADGYMISAWVNGVLVQQADTSRLPELKHRHLSGWIGLQDHNAHTEFRNLRVLEAPPGVGLTDWQKPRPLSGATLVLNRLMNLDVLTQSDGTTSAAVTHVVASDGEEVVAELSGPGAVVELTAGHARGRLSFYFDDDSKPAVDCPAEKLAEHLPLVGPAEGPLLSYVPFKDSLKITAKQAAGSYYRLLYVTLPSSVQVEAFAGPDHTVPRGWLPAISYRYQQHGWGGMREQDEDLDPREKSGKHTLEPGQRVSLKLDGAGIVEWFKLHAADKALGNNDLWLEVDADGEKTPAVAAPARFFFPGLAGGKRYQNFVALYSKDHGYVNRLPLPFAGGIELSAINRGKKTIKDVELSVSVDRGVAKSAEWLPRSRLRGVFQKRADDAPATFTGPGRWVGLVCRHNAKDGAEPTLDASIDERPVPGWSDQPLGILCGLPSEETGRYALCGRSDGMLWRWLLEAPVDFEHSIALSYHGAQLGDRLALFYVPEKQ